MDAPTSPRRAAFPAIRPAWWLAGAFVLGLVAFLALIAGRDDDDFFRADTVPPTADGPRYEPLPAPMPADIASGLPTRPAAPPESTSAVEEEAPVVAAPVPVPTPPAEAAPRPSAAAAAGATRNARPIPGRTPSPAYPLRALREGASGTSLVIVHIGPDGVPTATELAQSAGSRELDRAALAAVRQWRFEPALEDGQPVVGRAVVPIEFSLAR